MVTCGDFWQATDNILAQITFQLLSLWLLSHETGHRDSGQTPGLSSRPEEMVHGPHLTSDQSASSTTPTPNPRGLVVPPCRICNLTYTPLGSWLFLDMSKPSLQVGQFHNKPLYFFTANFCSCISFSQCAQTDRLKYWSLIINSK